LPSEEEWLRLKDELGEKEARLARSQQELVEKERRIVELEKDLAEAEASIAESGTAAEEVSNSLKQRINNLKAELNTLVADKIILGQEIQRLTEERNQTKDRMIYAMEQVLWKEIRQENEILKATLIIGAFTLIVAVWGKDIADLSKKLFRGMRKLLMALKVIVTVGRRSNSTPTPPSAPSINLVSLSSLVSAGTNASLEIQVVPGAVCSPGVIYKSGASSAKGLVPKEADSQGRVSWVWRVAVNTTPGRSVVYVDCDPGGYCQWSFEVHAQSV
jgi:hypothetical protein